MQFIQAVERVLHAPGNFTKDILEMTLVLDYSTDFSQAAREMMGILKSHSQVFRNVRLNILKWVDDEHLECECVPMPVIQMGRILECAYEADKHKTLDMLLKKLKVFHARSKLILVYTEGSYDICSREEVLGYMNLFLKRKIIFVSSDSIGLGLAGIKH